MRAVLAALITALSVITSAWAHVPAMGVLELREVRPGSFVAGWTLEPTIGPDRVKLQFPPHCHSRCRAWSAVWAA